jgi:hypothetical protein
VTPEEDGANAPVMMMMTARAREGLGRLQAGYRVVDVDRERAARSDRLAGSVDHFAAVGPERRGGIEQDARRGTKPYRKVSRGVCPFHNREFDSLTPSVCARTFQQIHVPAPAAVVMMRPV